MKERKEQTSKDGKVQLKEGVQGIKERGSFIASQFTTSVSSMLGAAKEKAQEKA